MKAIARIGKILELIKDSTKPYNLAKEPKLLEMLGNLPYVDHDLCLAASVLAEPEEKDKESDKEEKKGIGRRMLAGRSPTAESNIPPKMTEIQKIMARQKQIALALPKPGDATPEITTSECSEEEVDKNEDLDESMEATILNSVSRKRKFTKFLEEERNQGMLEFWEAARKFQHSYPKRYEDVENIVKTYIIDKAPKRLFIDKTSQETILSEFSPSEAKVNHFKNVIAARAAAARIAGSPAPQRANTEVEAIPEDLTYWEGDPDIFAEAISWTGTKLRDSHDRFLEGYLASLQMTQEEVDKVGVIEWYAQLVKKNDGGDWLLFPFNRTRCDSGVL